MAVQPQTGPIESSPPDTAPQTTDGQTRDGPQPISSFDPELGLDQRWTGDLDGMAERGQLRALVTYSKTNYFLDGGTQRGITYEALREFETFLNKRLGRRTLKVSVVIIPVRRDELLPAVAEGLGDLAAANLTITPSREQTVDFSEPLAQGIAEVVVTGPAAPELEELDDLSGMEIHARPSSSYWASLTRLNQDLVGRGLDPIQLIPADEFLEDEDLLEMVNAGLLPMAVVDSHKAEFWAGVFDNLVVRRDLVLRSDASIGWAFRKNSPQLAAAVSDFSTSHRAGTLFGNVILQRYLKQNKWVKNHLADADRERIRSMIHLFQEYGDQYGFDFLMLAALAYQESGLDQSKRSRTGAVGVMQMLPSTATDPNVDIPNIEELEANIHAGTKYLRFLRDRYFSDQDLPDLDRQLFTFAAYNAGPARVRKLRTEAAEMGLDPNSWFGNVEVVAAKRVGRETVQYVSNISKYYVAYRLAVGHLVQKGAISQ